MPKVIPFKDTILVRRRKVGSTLKDGKTKGGIILPNVAEERYIDLADVVAVPEFTFDDQKLLDNAQAIVDSLAKKAGQGDGEALKSLGEFSDFLKRKSIKVGDAVFLSRYVGTDFTATGETELQTIVKVGDILGIVIDE